MKIACIGGGPAGLYLGILMKKADPAHEVVVVERNRADDTFGFGVVFSDATLGNLAAADPESYDEIRRHFAHWDDIDTHIGGEVIRSTGHGFCGLERKTLLGILQRRAESLGVTLRFETEVTDLDAFADADVLVGADGVASLVRDTYADAFEPEIDVRPNKFVWLGTTFPFEAFTFYFKQTEHGLLRVHAYRYQEAGSTFIVECTEETWRRAGLDQTDEDQTIAYLEAAFAAELDGHRLIKNRSIWRSFPTIRCKTWHHGNAVLVGDAVHTAHFSIGSGTKLAMEDCIDLTRALADQPDDVPAALAAYEAARRPAVEALQRAAQVSLEWFENTEWYVGLDPLAFAFSLLTRSLRVTHANLRKRDPALVARVDRAFAARARVQVARATGEAAASEEVATGEAAPPMLAPLALRGLVLANRIALAPITLGRAVDGQVGDWHLVHLGGRAVGGAGLIMTEVSAVRTDGYEAAGAAGLCTDEHARAWRRITQWVHAHTPAAIGVALGHGDYREPGERRELGEPGDADAAVRVSDSAAMAEPTLDEAAMGALREAFVRAATRAEAAGFDLIELQLGAGVLGRFLDPAANQRADGWGGDLAGRMRYPLDIVGAVRAAWSARRPLTARIAVGSGGVSADDAVELARALVAAGCDAIAVAGTATDTAVAGTATDTAGGSRGAGRLAHTPLSDRVRNLAGVPTIAVGGITSAADINSVLAAGRADLCALGRALVFDPNLPRRVACAAGCELPWPAPYARAAGFVPRD